MKSTNTNNKCSQIRAWLYTAISSCFGPEAKWLQNHVANCPRCQRRLVAGGKVNLAISLMKSQRHRLDLLMRANTQAIDVLKHCLREAPKARKLRTKQPEPKLLEKCYMHGHSALNCAACIAILFLMKIGVFSSMDQFHTKGQKAYQQYYTKQVGEDLTNEIFS